MKKTIILTIALLLASGGYANADFTFGEPVNLGPPFNTPSREVSFVLSADGLEMYISSERSGGLGYIDMWRSTRENADNPWGPLVNIQEINSGYNEAFPCLSADGLTLYFSDWYNWNAAGDRPGGAGDHDLWMCTRASRNDPWGTPVNMGVPINSGSPDISPTISHDGLTFIFASKRSGGLGDFDLWMSTRPDAESDWAAPVNMGPAVNSSAFDAEVWLSTDGLALFFCSNRPGGSGSYDVWMCNRPSVQEAWSPPVNLGPVINTSGIEGIASLSPDQKTLYFGSSKPGGIGDWDMYEAPIVPIVDFNADEIVDFRDLSMLFECWLQNEPAVDIAPTPFGDGIVDFKDLAVFAEYWVEEILYIKWFAHASVKIWTEDAVVYVDPRNLSESPHDATLVLVTHTHGDHYQPADIARVSNDQTKFIAPPDVVQQYGQGQAIAPGQTIVSSGVPVTAVRSYNINKTNHPESNNWVGYIIELGGKRIYVAGDTDLIPEMHTLGKIDVAFLPAGGTYTMNAVEAAEATEYIKPRLAIPYHWGTSVGTLADAQTFAELARCAVKIMSAGETISSDNWPEYSPLRAHWKLDETEGSIAADSAGAGDGTLHGEPLWRPAAGKVDGALDFDGVNDYVSADFVLDPAEGQFSVFAWVKGGGAGQVVISQTDGTGTGAAWLCAESSQGKLMTGLVPPASGRFATPPLVSEFIIIDNQWYHIGFVWDGSRRRLYVDGTEVAADAATLAPLKSATGGMYIGAGKGLEAGSLWSGLIDDVHIYDVALNAEEIEELAH